MRRLLSLALTLAFAGAFAPAGRFGQAELAGAPAIHGIAHGDGQFVGRPAPRPSATDDSRQAPRVPHAAPPKTPASGRLATVHSWLPRRTVTPSATAHVVAALGARLPYFATAPPARA